MRAPIRMLFTAALSVLPVAIAFAQEGSGGTAVIELDETVISGNQELPKVLYILPWQAPEGLPDLQVKADFTEAEVFRKLYPPSYRRELEYFNTLNRSADSEE
ncbi:MAG: hypothetical protein AAGG11_22775 [Pseudomonadota bacterium]